MKVYDENALPAAKTQKTIHQRNKSSPALSSLSQAGGLKLAAKRTAFGDLSNTANLLRPSKDDSTIGSKNDLRLKENLPPIQEKRSTNLQKPAQRPASVTGLRSLLNNTVNPVSHTTVKQPLAEAKQQHPQPTHLPLQARTITNKKSTAVFKDSEQPKRPLPEPPQTVLESTSVVPVAPVHRELPPNPSNLMTSEQDMERKPSHTESQYSDAPDVQEDPIASSSAETISEAALPTSDGIYIDEQGEVQVYDYRIQNEYQDETDERAEAAPVISSENYYATRVPLSDCGSTVKTNGAFAETASRQKLPPVSEPEEYWDEDEQVEAYDEDGYVTARSYKSRGDNTGGATTVMFPKQTQKEKKEIALATQLIEGSKTVEELEDEAWDTTMVAEYGDEIFQYMKDLEVRVL